MNTLIPLRRPALASLTLTCACTIALEALAEDEKRPNPYVLMPEVVTSATRNEHDSFTLPMSIDSVDRSVIREDKLQVNLSESLNRVPGVSVLNRQNYAQDLQISSRGFGARSAFGVRGIRLLTDGIPATLPDGSGQTATFDLNSAERIEVMRGPFSSLYGNAAGGVIQLFTADGPADPTLSGSVFGGSYGTYKGDLQFGGTDGRFNYNFDGSRFHSDGYRDHSTVTRDLYNAKFKMPAANGQLTFVLNAIDQPETQDPLGLNRTQLSQNARQADPSALLFNTRKSVRQNQIGVVYDVNLGANDKLQARTYVGDRQVTQYQAIPIAAQLAATSSGGVVDQDFGYEGIGLRWTHNVFTGERPLSVTTGFDYDRMAAHRYGYMNNFGIQGILKRDEVNKVTNSDAFAQTEWKFAQRWSLNAGLRYNSVKFNSTDYYLSNGNDSGAVTYTKTTPVAGVLFNVTPTINAYANIGRGFETPTLIELAYRNTGGGLNFSLQPATSLTKEVGIKAQIAQRARVNLAVFQINTNQEIVVDQSVGGRTTYKNAPQTYRKGVEFSAEAYLGAGFEGYFSYTWLDARFTQQYTTNSTNCITTTATTQTVTANKNLPGVPGYNVYGEIVWRYAPLGFHAGAEVRANGKIYVNDLNCAFAEPATVGNLRAGFEQRQGKIKFSEFVRIDNITNRPYVGSVIIADGNNRFFEPSPTRNYLVGANAQWQF